MCPSRSFAIRGTKVASRAGSGLVDALRLSLPPPLAALLILQLRLVVMLAPLQARFVALLVPLAQFGVPPLLLARFVVPLLPLAQSAVLPLLLARSLVPLLLLTQL